MRMPMTVGETVRPIVNILYLLKSRSVDIQKKIKSNGIPRQLAAALTSVNFGEKVKMLWPSIFLQTKVKWVNAGIRTIEG